MRKSIASTGRAAGTCGFKFQDSGPLNARSVNHGVTSDLLEIKSRRLTDAKAVSWTMLNLNDSVIGNRFQLQRSIACASLEDLTRRGEAAGQWRQGQNQKE